MKKIAYLVSAAIGITTYTHTVQAGGFIADALKGAGLINEDQRRALDGAHAQMGNPLDHTANGVATYYAPGSVQAYQQYKHMNNYQPPQYYSPPQQYYQPPQYYSPPQQYYNQPYYGR